MGEYVKHAKLGKVKLGTCENLFYVTIQQYAKAFKNGLLSFADGNDHPENYLRPDIYIFRFPFPDEDNIKAFDAVDPFKGELFSVPDTLRFEIGHEENCPTKEHAPENKEFIVYGQKLVTWNDKLEIQTVIKCPYCRHKCRIDEKEAKAHHINVDDNWNQYTDLQREIVKRILAGYEHPNSFTAKFQVGDAVRYRGAKMKAIVIEVPDTIVEIPFVRIAFEDNQKQVMAYEEDLELYPDLLLVSFKNILDSYTNGQMSQVKKLIDKLDPGEKLVFVGYMGAHANEEQKEYITNYLLGTGNAPINF